jgi:hypothetical protein
MLIPNMKPDNLLPIMEKGVTPVLKGNGLVQRKPPTDSYTVGGFFKPACPPPKRGLATA